METFEITVQELLSKKISVKAKNISDALNEVQKMYNDEKVVLDYTDLTMQEIIPTSQIDKKDKLINEVIEYIYADEEKHFEENEEPNDHFFLKLKALKNIIDGNFNI